LLLWASRKHFSQQFISQQWVYKFAMQALPCWQLLLLTFCCKLQYFFPGVFFGQALVFVPFLVFLPPCLGVFVLYARAVFAHRSWQHVCTIQAPC
jgi:uncharacterized membrane protein